MTDKTSKQETKRKSKGQRTYIRRLKQAARKEIGANTPQSNLAQQLQAQKKLDQS